MDTPFRLLAALLLSGLLASPEALAVPTIPVLELDPRWAPESVGKPPRPGDTGATLPDYGEDRHGALSQDMAAVGAIVGATIVPVSITMVKWKETYNERSLRLEVSDREEAAELLQTYGITSAIVAPLAGWGGFMAGGGFRQRPMRAFLCGVAASAISYPVGSYLGRAVADPVLDIEGGAQPRSPNRSVFLGSLVWNGVVTTGAVAGIAFGGGDVVRRARDPGFTMLLLDDGVERVWVPTVQGRF